LPAVLAGCSSQSDGLAPVQGIVTYQGKPLENALVVFIPETPNLLPASDLTDGSGRYELMTKVPGDGASIGKHRVTVTARGPEKTSPGQEIGLPEIKVEAGPLLIPARYSNPDSSGLTAEVKPEGAALDFELKD
jgi:hypothetical protein